MANELKKIKFVEAMVLYGSCGRKDPDFYSDIDLIVYLEANDNFEQKSAVKNAIINCITISKEKIYTSFDLKDKWVLYTDLNFIKLEIKIKSKITAKDDIIFIVESRIDSAEKAVVFDKNGFITEIYKANWIQLNNLERLKKEFIEEINEFCYYYDDFFVQITRGDEYRAYMNYTVAFYKLVSLIAIAEGEYYNLYQPWNLFSNIIKDERMRELLFTVSSSLKKKDLFFQKDNLLKIFLETMDKGAKKFNLGGKVSKLNIFFKKVENKYLFHKNL